MRNVAVFGRLALGGYLAAHGAQKLFGVLGGQGLDATAASFERLGLTPAREMAMLAGAAELGGGLLTATGVADPLGPVTIAGAMAVATAVQRKKGPFASDGGYELPLTNLALATALVASGPGALRLGPRLPRPLATAVIVGAALVTAVPLAKLLTYQAPPSAIAVEPDETDQPDDASAPTQSESANATE